jgi:hypothetical protein
MIIWISYKNNIPWTDPVLIIGREESLYWHSVLRACIRE